MSVPSTAWREVIAPDEDATLRAMAAELHAIQRRRAAGGHPARALHAKGHIGCEAHLRIFGDIPEHARQGLFAQPASYRAVVRFSNGSGAMQRDRTGDVRGIAIKVLGVPGRKVIPGLEDARTQDFLCIQSSATPFRTPHEFMAVVVAASGNPALLLPRLISRLGLKRSVALAKALRGSLARPFTSFAGQPMYSALPIRFGPYAVRYALLPRPVDAASAPAPAAGDHALSADLAAHLRNRGLSWDVAVQFFVDESVTPIEDASVDWPAESSPYVRLARLELPRQEVWDAGGIELGRAIDQLSFDPWHALEEHRPLGQMMRARGHAYYLSTQERRAAGEPGDADLPLRLPDAA